MGVPEILGSDAVFWISFLACALLITANCVLLKQLGRGRRVALPDFPKSYDARRLRRLFAAYNKTASTKAAYGWIRRLDQIFPAAYCAFLAAGIWRCTETGWLILFPVVAAAADYAENLLLARLYADYSQLDGKNVERAWLMTRLKWYFIAASFLVPFLA